MNDIGIAVIGLDEFLQVAQHSYGLRHSSLTVFLDMGLLNDKTRAFCPEVMKRDDLFMVTEDKEVQGIAHGPSHCFLVACLNTEQV